MKRWTPKQIAMTRRKLVRFVCNFRCANFETN